MKIFLMSILVATLTFSQTQEFEVPGYECGDCHGASGWTILALTGFDHDFTDFPLKDNHQMQPCTACHSGGTVQEKHNFSLAATGCGSCHLDVHRSELGLDCEECHSFRSWQVTQQTFDHEMTRFSLLGAHNLVACEECHKEKPMVQFRDTPLDCMGCHEADYAQVTTPSHVLAKLNHDCTSCHPVGNIKWSPSPFTHDTFYELTGSHRTIDCYQCHEGVFQGTASDCRSCHSTEFNATGSPTYPDAPPHTGTDFFADQCEECHSTTTWLPVNFDHVITGYPLDGKHRETTCDQCHGAQGYNLPLDCQGCHQPGGIAVTNILDGDYDHVTHNLPIDCQLCHITQGWDQSQFKHDNFALETCEDCHLIEHTESQDPPHGNGNISTDCILCHDAGEGWDIPSFSHLDVQTGYALLGLHVLVDCTLCHQNNIFSATPNTCQDNLCHSNLYNDAMDPDHISYAYPIQYCDICHNELGWAPSMFSHSVSDACATCHLPDYSGAINPVHEPGAGFTQTCENCHTSTDIWQGASMDHSTVTDPCVTCHLDDYQGTTDPDHAAKSYSQDCTQCHNSTEDWLDVQIDHSGYTDPCATCHINDYNGAVDPNHVDNSFATDCELCHTSTTVWRTDNYPHAVPEIACLVCHQSNYDNTTEPAHPVNQFDSDCLSCHESTATWVITNYSHGLPDFACSVCHMTDYNTTLDPDHAGNNYSTDCTLCHNSTLDWTDVTFDHTNITQACVDCHIADYQSVVNPNHSALAYPEDCLLCHNTVNWEDDFFNHVFPIYSGSHANEWSTCTAECHISPADFSVFSCGLNGVCHDHDKSEMDDEHSGESGYVYESWACYDCHPNGEEGDDDDGGDRRLPRKNKGWRNIFKNSPLK